MLEFRPCLRLSNDLPISGEGRIGSSIVPLPGPRGARRSSVEPRGPGSLNIDRELTAFVRFIGLLDNGSRPTRLRRPSWRSRFRLPQRFPRGSKTSLSRSPDGCPCP